VTGSIFSNSAEVGLRLAPGNNGRSVRGLTHNTFIGNEGPGLHLFGAQPVTGFTENDFIANHTTAIPLDEWQGKGENCGLLNFSSTTVIAARNFWGSPSGPGSDSADRVCDVAPAVTVVKPVGMSPYNN
jgi:hypothetical protein